MYSKEELKNLKLEFWESFAAFCEVQPYLRGRKKIWTLYDTKVKGVEEIFDANRQGAYVILEVNHRSEDLRLEMFERLTWYIETLEQDFPEGLIWDICFVRENGRQVARIYVAIEGLDLHRRAHWGDFFNYMASLLNLLNRNFMGIEEYLKEKLYEIRGKRVLLDADLAEIYGYTNKRFNEQVRNNIEKFDSDFMFELTDDETEYLRTNFSTTNISSKSRYNPHVFTEQGLYMLMTVLKGPLAVKQSKALIRTFKKMKDYILENRDLIGQRELLQLSMETANNRIEISKINSDMISLEKQISDVAEGLKDVVTKSELADMMNSFISDDDEKWLMFKCGIEVGKNYNMPKADDSKQPQCPEEKEKAIVEALEHFKMIQQK